ncbi:hypothetical protein IQ07DRAFT_588939 [Pyrenochaeta sp. DS3sAY3a]|nr:hypothetical protein IQ07DRAFT_588939 [Pyrenochaeta sp. DS3sAY3a]
MPLTLSTNASSKHIINAKHCIPDLPSHTPPPPPPPLATSTYYPTSKKSANPHRPASQASYR